MDLLQIASLVLFFIVALIMRFNWKKYAAVKYRETVLLAYVFHGAIFYIVLLFFSIFPDLKPRVFFTNWSPILRFHSVLAIFLMQMDRFLGDGKRGIIELPKMLWKRIIGK